MLVGVGVIGSVAAPDADTVGMADRGMAPLLRYVTMACKGASASTMKTGLPGDTFACIGPRRPPTEACRLLCV